MLPDEGLRQHFLTEFTLFYHHNRDPGVFDDMIPWERDILLNLLAKEVEEENLRIKLEQQANKNKAKKPVRIKKNR